jgi:hypothetical protein
VSTFIPSALLKAQDEFFRDLCRLREAIATRHPTWIVTPAEIGIQKVRRGISSVGVKETYSDSVHKATSLHYSRQAADLNICVPTEDGRYRLVTSSDAPEWAEVHKLWKAIHPLNRVMPSSSADANHLSRAVTDSDPRI